MDNWIFNDNTENTYGFYGGMKAELIAQLKEFTRDEDWEKVQEMTELLTDLEEWKESDNMLVLSENNGMGYTIKEYEKGD